VVLESIIAICGLASLPLLLNLDHLMAALPAGGTSLAAKFGIAMLVLVLPTTAMGATFPVMAAALIREDQELAPRMSQFYALNTAGAVLGAWFGAFFLIPKFGLDGAVYVAATLNVAAAALGWHLDGQLRAQPEDKKVRPPAKASRRKKRKAAAKAAVAPAAPIADVPSAKWFALLVLVTTGLVSIASEVAWTKYLAIFTGSTIYGFASILVAFLLGVAGGSALSRQIQAEKPPSVRWLGIAMLVLAASLLLTRAGLSFLPSIDYQMRAGDVSGLDTPSSMERFRYVIITMMLLAPTLVFGAVFPASLSLWCGDAAHVPGRVGRGYAANTASGIVGSLMAGFWLIPVFGSDWVLSSGTMIVAAVALVCCVASIQGARRFQLAGVGLLLAGAPLVTPGLDYEQLIASAVNLPGAYIKKREAPEFLYLKEGKVAVVSLLRWAREEPDTAYLYSNSLREAKLPQNPDDPPPRAEVFLGTVPVLVHPNPSTMFIVGFGGGNTLKAALGTKISEVRVAELEPAMVDAVRTYREGEVPALEDPRSTLLIGDARNILLVEDRTYDVLVSQPSHPWVAGAGNLFTREFFEIARSRLNPGGIHGQWVSLFGLDATGLRAILKAFYETYDEGFCLMLKNTGDLLLLGSDQPIRMDFGEIAQRVRALGTRAWFEQWRVRSGEAFMWYFALSREGALKAAGDIPPNTDTSIVTEVRGTFGQRQRKADDPSSPYRVLADAFRFDVLEVLEPGRAADDLELMARTFATWQLPGAEMRARYALEQLAKLDRARAQALAAELQLR
jgi:spermidine synthase